MLEFLRCIADPGDTTQISGCDPMQNKTQLVNGTSGPCTDACDFRVEASVNEIATLHVPCSGLPLTPCTASLTVSSIVIPVNQSYCVTPEQVEPPAPGDCVSMVQACTEGFGCQIVIGDNNFGINGVNTFFCVASAGFLCTFETVICALIPD